ncbi:hypothetical protein [Stenotrophomonas maltophilia]|uniref:hypothetical protein n=1 Tax=Stenotrophomonas maltophilia TaxID=40324 RepID=UPI00192E3CD1|nr:hypothetical protein [Stenotrophomonas maltophilia]
MTERLTDPLDRLEASITDLSALMRPAASNNLNTIRIEGAGSIWNGIAIGLSLAGVILGAVWIAHVASNVDVAARQAEAYQKAVYMLAPRFAEEVDKELDRQKERDKK